MRTDATTAFREGFIAYIKGQDVKSCPYYGHTTDMRMRWHDGWERAKEVNGGQFFE